MIITEKGVIKLPNHSMLGFPEYGSVKLCMALKLLCSNTWLIDIPNGKFIYPIASGWDRRGYAHIDVDPILQLIYREIHENTK